MASIRVSPELKELLTKVAKKADKDVSFVVRIASRRIKNNHVIGKQIDEAYYKNNLTEIIPLWKFQNPSQSPEDFRRLLACVLLEELEKVYKPMKTASTHLVAGVDYIVEEWRE